jgi:DNA repair exonuclease SbcCD ATPase subunit
MTSLVSFSQTVITEDSLICLPRKYVELAAIEVTLYDLLKEEVESLKQDTTELNEIIFYRDYIISRRDEEIKAYQSTIDNCNVSRAGLEARIQTLSTELKETQGNLKTCRRSVGVLSLFSIGLSILVIKNE